MTRHRCLSAPILIWVGGVFGVVAVGYLLAIDDPASSPALRTCQMDQVHEPDGTSRWVYPCHEEVLRA